MILKQTVLATVLGGAIAFAPASAPAAFPVPPLPMAPVAADPVQKTVDERVKDIEKQLTEIVEMLKGKKDSQGFPLPTDPGLAEEVKRLKDEVAALRKQIDEMKKTTALRPDPADPMAGKGTVRVVNEYPVQIAIVINDKSYRVESNTKVDITVPAGEFSYQLLNSGSSLTPIKSTLKEKEVVTLRIK